MADLTDAEIAELERLEREATPGPWDGLYGLDHGSMSDIVSGDTVVAQRMQEADADFAIAAQRSVPSLLAEVKRLRASRAAAPPEPWTDCNDRKCGRCSACRGLIKYGPSTAWPSSGAASPDREEARCGVCGLDGLAHRGLNMAPRGDHPFTPSAPPSPSGGPDPIQWLGCADTVERLNERYGPATGPGRSGARFIALGGPDTLYDTGPDRKGKTRVPMGWWVCDVGGAPTFAAERPPAPSGEERERGFREAAAKVCRDERDKCAAKGLEATAETGKDSIETHGWHMARLTAAICAEGIEELPPLAPPPRALAPPTSAAKEE